MSGAAQATTNKAQAVPVKPVDWFLSVKAPDQAADIFIAMVLLLLISCKLRMFIFLSCLFITFFLFIFLQAEECLF